jgi:signal transduction histidine kinase
MFRKLRNRILTLNALSICIVIIVSFAAVFILTVASIEDLLIGLTDDEQLYRVSGPGMSVMPGESATATSGGAAGSPDDAGAIAIDPEDSQKALTALLFRLVCIAASVLVAVILISVFFANRAVRPVREAWERQRRFIAYASHELKTPLMTISANHDVLLAHKDETIGSQREWIDYAQAGTERMGKLISKMLDLADAESGPGARRTVDTDGAETYTVVSALLEEEFALLNAQAKKKSIRVVWEGKNRDKAEIPSSKENDARRVIAVLAENAVKYAEEGGVVSVSVGVRTRNRLRGAEAVIDITNTGPGIESEDLPYIFENFYRADRARTNGKDSYGLGLSIAKALADRSGFTLTAKSEPGFFTTFRLVMPARRPG